MRKREDIEEKERNRKRLVILYTKCHYVAGTCYKKKKERGKKGLGGGKNKWKKRGTGKEKGEGQPAINLVTTLHH